jgi:hypothetical protein
MGKYHLLLGKEMSRTFFLGLFFLLVHLTSCSVPGGTTIKQPTLINTPNPVLQYGLDYGMFTGEPCKLPCWNGLTPGLSQSNDVDHFIEELGLKNWPGRRTIVYNPNCKMIQISDSIDYPKNAVVNLIVDSGKLTYIGSGQKDMPNLRQIVDRLGSPEYYEALHAIGPDGEAYFVTIFYPKLGVVFQVTVDLEDLGFIKPDMVVNDIEYFEKGDLLSYFLARNSCGVGREGEEKNAQFEIKNFIQPWSGFGEVNVIQTR